MNLLLTLTTLILSSTSFAAKTYQWPSVGGLPINNACATSTSFKSVQKVKTCVETAVGVREACRETGAAEFCHPLSVNEKPMNGETVRESMTCIKYEALDLVVPRTSLVKKCTQWDDSRRCTKYETARTTMGKSFKVETYEELSDMNLRFLGYMDFEIPDCK